jgi:hypothetical protein
VRREDVVVVAEAAEVDDPGQPGVRRRDAERLSGRGVVRLEGRLVEGVDELVGSFAGCRGGGERLGLGDVAEHRLPRPGVAVRAPGHRPHLVACVVQRRAKPAADEPGRAGDEELHLPSLGSAGGLRHRAYRGKSAVSMIVLTASGPARLLRPR